ncbi:MAG: OmpA family protein [Flavobacteriaceae bacterium]|nr:OmpA family protein [Flavobacteriaceae bacterium]
MNKLTLHFLLLSSILSFSQDRISGDPITFTKNWIIKVGVNAVDESRDWKPFDFLNDQSTSAFSNPIALGVEYRFANANSISLFGSLNKWKADEGIIDGELLTEDRSFSAIDLSYKFYFDHFFLNANWLDIYAEAGLGLFFISATGPFNERQSKLSQNLGFGSIIWFSKSIGLNLQVINKFSREENNTGNHVQYFAGLAIKLKNKDFDRDGVKNQDDLCPSVFGEIELNGCPDSDGDGITDIMDSCPNEAGKSELNGCPDSDNDGISDSSDKCPYKAGSKDNYGCPLPEPIVEAEPIIETKPEIVTEPGEPGEEVLKTLNDYARTILFDYSKSLFKQETYEVLQSISDIIKTYPEASFIIEGHTDSLGSHITNDRLSKARANAVRDYLISNGIASERLTAIGYGERRPKFSNATKGGRDQNRRVEVKLKK